jgi:8-oxo-dGTP diphosphatase
MSDDVFPIFSPISIRHIGYKSRDLVHKDGDWHRGIQANIIRQNRNGGFDVLVQQRSDGVDIGRNKYDQSLAVQMLQEDNLDCIKSLRRGMLSELGIKKSEFTYSLAMGDQYIIKKYKDDTTKLNREVIRLYIVKLNKNIEPKVRTQKIRKLEWMEWKSFQVFFSKNKRCFTKTAQYYFSHNTVMKEIENSSNSLLRGQAGRRRINQKTLLYINLEDDRPILHTVRETITQLIKEEI